MSPLMIWKWCWSPFYIYLGIFEVWVSNAWLRPIRKPAWRVTIVCLSENTGTPKIQMVCHHVPFWKSHQVVYQSPCLPGNPFPQPGLTESRDTRDAKFCCPDPSRGQINFTSSGGTRSSFASDSLVGMGVEHPHNMGITWTIHGDRHGDISTRTIWYIIISGLSGWVSTYK